MRRRNCAPGSTTGSPGRSPARRRPLRSSKAPNDRHRTDPCLWADRSLWPRLRSAPSTRRGPHMPIDKRAERNGRQGVRTPLQEAMTVLDPETMQPVPWDGETMGEIMFRGNITMKGYLKNPSATEAGFCGRMVPYRRSRCHAAGRLCENPRPVEGHHHLRRREHFLDRGGGDAVSPSRR